MSDSVKYWEEQDLEPKQEKELSKDVVNILELFRLLSVEDKATAKRVIKEENIF